MQFNINREKLLKPLQQIVNVIEKRQTMPILANVLLKLNQQTLVLSGTDLEIQIVAQLDVDSSQSGETTVPARKFLDICRLLPAEAVIKFKADETKVKIESEKSRFSLTTLAAENYPGFPENDADFQFTIAAEKLKIALDKTLFCMANQDFRYYLNGLMMNVSNQSLKLVASDGHRLSIYHGEIDEATELDNRIIIPRKGIQELARLLEHSENEVTLLISKNQIKVLLENLIFSAKLIDAKYPDFSKIYQQEYLSPIRIDKKLFKEALTRVAILAHEKSKGISLQISSEKMLLTAYNPAQEEAEEEMQIEFSGTPTTISFNGQYLLEAVSNIDAETLVLTIASNLSSCFIQEPEDAPYKFIVMPMTL